MKLSELLWWFVVFICTILAVTWIVTTFTATSYEYGTKQEISSDLKFIIQSPTLVLTQKQIEDGIYSNDIYVSEKSFTSVFQVDSEFNATENEYEFEFNGSYIPEIEMSAGYVEANLNYTFLGTQGQELFTDILYITLNFYSNETILKVETHGGQTAAAYWLSYFNTNGLDIRVYEKGEVL